MADPRPLTRKELAEFLPNQRAIRAFEKLFDLVPPELGDILLLAESALLSAQAAHSENTRLSQRIIQLELELLAAKKNTGLDQLIKRVEILETLETLGG
jgi:hypothetical protein